ncbi:T9SS type A sorting domain-containing protein [Ekhidna sp.]|uniref:T9SS type A sorting domain-containing protein n=1 Tax=Ekhidna sp. TaxID=2608089 RepID=UPI0035130DCD
MDTQVPTFVSATFYDFDNDGSIDEILVEMSEPIDESSIETADFQIGGVAAVFTVLPGGSVGVDNASDISTTDQFFTLDVDLGNTADPTFEYIQDNASAELSDLAGNEASNDLFITTIDAAPPVLTGVQFEDLDNDGFVDRVVYVFSEVVSDADDNDTHVVAEVGSITLPDGQPAGGFVDGDIVVSDDGTFGFVAINNITGQITENTSVGSFDVSGVNGLWDDEHDLTSIGDGAENHIDAAAPIIVAADNILQASNAYLQVTFSEGVYNSGGLAVSTAGSEFTLNFLQNTGTATAAVIDDLTQTDDATPTAAGDNVIRFQLAVTGSTNGNETIAIVPTNGTSVYDASNNPMLGTQTTGVIPLNAVAKASFVDAYMDATNSFLIVEFSDPMSRDGSDDGNKETQWRNDRGLFYQSYSDGGSGVVFSLPTSADMLKADGSAITVNGEGAQTQLRVNTSSVTGTPTGLESFQVYNPSVSKLKSFPGSKTLDPGATITVFLSDEFGDLFNNATAVAYDRDNDGIIDSVAVDMTDDILDATIDLNDFTFGGVNPTGFDTGTTSDDDLFALLFTTYPHGTGVTSTLDYTSDGLSTRLTDDAGNNIVDGSVSPTDAALPRIASASINSSNAYLEVIFSETVYPADGTINLADFDITIFNSTATVTVTDVLDAQGNSGLASEDTLRFTLNVAPNALAPDGTETVEVSTDGTTFDDVAANGLAGSETTGAINLNVVTDQITVTNITYSVKAADQGYIEYTFSEGLLSGDAGTARIANSTSGIIETGNWTNGSADSPQTDDVNFQYAANGSPVTIDDADATDIQWTDNSDNIIVYNTGTGGYTGTVFRFHLNDINGGPFRGVETYTINAVDGRVSGRTTGGPWIESNSYVFTLPDLYSDTLASVQAFDVNADGNIDEIVITLSDDIDDTTLPASLADFSINGGINNGVSPSSVVATPLNGIDPNNPDDHIFTLGFTSYVGTAVDGNLDFTQGNLTDDAGNVILTGSKTPADMAGPAILSAITADTDNNGFIDEISVNFSETLTVNGNSTFFTVSEGVDTYTVNTATPSGSQVTLSISEGAYTGNGTWPPAVLGMDTYITPDVTVNPLYAEDAGGADNVLQTFTNTDDGAAPYIAVNTSSGNATPDFSGVVDDPNATLIISVDGDTRSNASIVNNGDGTWSYTSAADTHVDGPITVGSQGFTTYEVTVIGIDSRGNNRTDVTSNEYTLTGGANVTAPTLGPICTSDGFQPLGQIIIDEQSNGDFSAGTNVTMRFTLPEGFEFNTAVSPNFSGSTFGDISAISSAFIGTASFRITLTIDNTIADDDLYIDDLQVKAVSGGASGSLEKTGGTAVLSTSATSFASMSSNTSPPAITFITDQDGVNLVDTTVNRVAYIDVVYSAPTAPPFTLGEEVTFGGGAVGIVVSDDGASNLQVYLTDGTIAEMTGVITGGVSGNTSTTTSASFNNIGIVSFSLDANIVGPDVAKWYDVSLYDTPPGPADSLISTNSLNTNIDLGVTSPGLYTFDIGLNDGTCDSESLRSNVLIYDDLSPEYEHTFTNNIYIEDDDRDTIYLSQPVNHTVSVSGAGVTVTNPSAANLLVLFDPSIAGSTNSPHTITYQVTNNITGESVTLTRQMTVNPVTEFFTVGPGHTNPPEEIYCIDELPVTLRLDPTQYGPDVNNDLQFSRFFYREWMNADAIGGPPTNGFYERRPADLGGSYPWATDMSLESASFTSSLAALNDGNGSALFVQRLTFDPIGGNTIQDFEYYFIYGTPLVSISNLESNYCDVDAAFTLTRDLQYVSSFTADDPNAATTRWNRNYTIEAGEPITNGYILEVWNGSSYDPYEDFTSTGPFGIVNEFDPSDPDQDGDTDEDESGQYRIIYVTENLTPAGCSGQTSAILNIRSPEATPFLDATTRTAGSSSGFFNNSTPDAGIDADEYVLEYCVGDVITSFTAVEESVYNYNNLYTGILTFPAGPVFQVNETFVGLTSGAKSVVTSVTATTVELTSITRDFIVGETIQGLTSGSVGTVSSFSEYVLTTENIQGLTSGATATITALGDNRFEFTPTGGTFLLNENFIGLGSRDIGRLTGLGEISWYNESEQLINAFENNYSITPGAVGLNVDGSFALRAEETQVFYFSTTSIYDCESELRKVTVNVFNIPNVPVVSTVGWPSAVKVGNIYTFDYCVEDDGSSTTPAQISLTDLLEDESYNISRRFWDASAGSAVTTPITLTEPGTSDTDPQLITVPDIFAGDSVIYLISRTENINLEPYNNFAGCTSDSITVNIVAQEEASPPTNLDFNASTTEFHICEGDNLPNINHTFIDGVDEYIWYEGVDGSNNGITRIGDPLGVGDPMTESTLETASTITSINSPGVYTVYVSRNNDIILSRGFDGCESEAVPITITTHAIQGAPSIVSDNGAASNFVDQDANLTDDVYNFKICSDQLDPTFTFVAGDLYAGDEQVEWRVQGETNPRFIGEQPTFSNLGLVGLSTGQVIYEVIQVTDTLTDSYGNFFAGCESPVAQLIIDIADPEDLEIVNHLGNTLSDLFCRDDDPLGDMSGNLTIELEVNSVTANTSRISSFTIDSYTETNFLINGPIDGTISGSNSFPTVNLITLHDGVTGSQAVGGDPTVHVVSFTYSDESTLCESIVSKAFYIYPDPDISITFNGTNADMLEFCYDDPDIVTTGVRYDDDIIQYVASNSGTFQLNGNPLSSSNGVAAIDPSDPAVHGSDPFATQSSHIISYTYTDAFGCINTVDRTILINPLPQIADNEIKSASTCAETDIKLFVEMIPNSLGQGKDAYNFIWRVGTTEVQNLDGTAGGDTLVYNLGTLNSAQFSVDVTYIGDGNPNDYATMCQSSIIGQTITVGEAPSPSIVWVGTTANNPDGTDFRITEDNAGLPDGDVNYVEFFVNGVSQFVTTTPTFPLNYNYNPGSPGYSFNTAGSYPVRVIMRTTAGCEVDTEVEYGIRNIEIIDHLAGLTSYTESFESGAGGWTVETLSLDGKDNSLLTSWEIGSSVPGSANFDGSNAVYTNGYQPSEQSFVYSPSFDLSAFSAPTISFLRYEDFETFRDGVVLQMSTDDGRTWVNVGSFDDSQPEGLKSTPNWYNREAITSAPGTVSPGPLSTANNGQGIGWALNNDWDEAIAPLAIPVGEEQYVRFRFALAAQATPKTTNGFAFDLVQIYDREQVVLLEQFSSTLDASSKTINNIIDNAPIFNGNDVVRINYFTDFANSGANRDQLNQRNTSAPGAKSSFYGIEDIPSMAIAGEAERITNASQLSGSISAQLTNAKLVNPGFDIAINASIDAENNLTVGADFTAISEIANTNTKLGLFIAILEPQIIVDGVDVQPIGLYQVNDTITNVLRKMLPSAAGQFEQGAIAVNDVLSIANITWPVSNMYVMDTLTVVAYVQNLTTKQVLQSDVMGLSNPNTELALGVDELADFSLYPNPADKQVTVEFVDGITQDTEWVIYDQAGREVLKGDIAKGTRTMTVRTAEMPSGMYFIHLYAEDRKRQAKRIMIVH